MARVQTVPKARKEHQCGKCGKPISVGEPYKWAKRRYGSKMIRHAAQECRFRNSDLFGAKTAQIDDAIEDAQDAISRAAEIDDIRPLLDDVATVARDVASEYEEASSAWAGGQNERFDELAQACSDFADECESWEPSVDLDAVKLDAAAEVEREKGESDADFEAREKDVQDEAVEEAFTTAKDEACDVLSNWSVP